ncbi:FtsK/SpoIIIE domain-containing protein [Micromonospora sp. NPDC049204]|uniref:FtsK/SpoIIIE domain-containing protein n=1 Tax=Micromonospora sp. NPDC049204 TaxID=3154351 RepID=UPI00340DC967
MTTTTPAAVGAVPVGPGLSMFDPIFVGIDEFGQPVYITLAYRNLLAGGEPGGGKSGLLNAIAAHAALAVDSRLVLLDGKLVELGQWEDCADAFIGPDITAALTVLRRLQQVMNNRYAWLRAHGRRKLTAADNLSVITVLVDEIAFFSATVGSKQEQEDFVALLRDLVARGRAAGIPVVAATQRPSFDIIPTSLRDLFGYRAAFRCTTPNSSNIVLGHGWAEQGYSATDISPSNQGAAYLIAEGGIPRRIKVAYLSDAHISGIADYAAWIRRPRRLADRVPDLTQVDFGIAA